MEVCICGWSACGGVVREVDGGVDGGMDGGMDGDTNGCAD